MLQGEGEGRDTSRLFFCCYPVRNSLASRATDTRKQSLLGLLTGVLGGLLFFLLHAGGARSGHLRQGFARSPDSAKIGVLSLFEKVVKIYYKNQQKTRKWTL